jgi:hypothetical protein
MLFGKHMQGSFSYMARLRGELDMNYAYEADNLSYGKKSMKKSNESKNLNTHQKLLEVQKYSLS